MAKRRLSEIRPDLRVDTGDKARSFIDRAGVRLYVPFRVTYEVQLSPLSITTDVLEFYLYAENAAVASQVAGKMLVLYCVKERRPVNGYPKPLNGGQATSQQIPDKEFTSIWKQAANQGKKVYKAMSKTDPVGFHIQYKPTTIYVPGPSSN
jgi:hypothetical protein